MKKLDVTSKIFTVKRSDGRTKIYGHTVNGELCTVIFDKDNDIDEVSVNSKITYTKQFGRVEK